jgi:hypothetical protein
MSIGPLQAASSVGWIGAIEERVVGSVSSSSESADLVASVSDAGVGSDGKQATGHDRSIYADPPKILWVARPRRWRVCNGDVRFFFHLGGDALDQDAPMSVSPRVFGISLESDNSSENGGIELRSSNGPHEQRLISKDEMKRKDDGQSGNT